MQDIKVREMNEEDLGSLYVLVQNTTQISYQGFYPDEAIEFFKNYHSKESIKKDAASGYTVVAEMKGEVVGTGTLLGTNIRRVFVKPSLQQKGIGRLIVQRLERRASAEKLATLDLDSSLASRKFWESMGFVLQKEDYIPVGNGKRLLFFKMNKTLGVHRAHLHRS